MRPQASLLWPILALMGSLLSLCFGTSFAKGLFPHVGATGTTAYRLTFAMLILMLVFRPWQKKWSRTDAPALLLYGLVLGSMNLLFYQSLKTIPFGLAIAVEFTGPLGLALWSSRRLGDIFWIVLAACGLLLVLPIGDAGLHAQALDPLGLLFAFLAGLCWATYIVIGQTVAKKHGGLATPMGMLAALLLVLPIGVWDAGVSLLNIEWMLLGLVVAVLSSAIPYSLEMYSLKHMPRQLFSILLSLEPVVGALAGWLVLAEVLTLSQWLAMLMIVAASMGCTWTVSRRQASPAQA
jgi:inner membrane transporter RhtA